MDPDETLRRLIRNCRKLRKLLEQEDENINLINAHEEDGVVEDIDQVLEDFLNLMHWLGNDGFPPEWKDIWNKLKKEKVRDYGE